MYVVRVHDCECWRSDWPMLMSNASMPTLGVCLLPSTLDVCLLPSTLGVCLLPSTSHRRVTNASYIHSFPPPPQDPYLHINSRGDFHVLAHCYTCMCYPHGDCNDTQVPSAHGFSANGRVWEWAGGHPEDSPYGFTIPAAGGGNISFSSRERPWLLHSDGQLDALLTAVSPPFPYDRSASGRDWAYTLITEVAH
jgi:hypothetical protein